VEHFIWRAAGRRTVLHDTPGRLAAIRALLRVQDTRVLLFSVVDNHVHAVFEGGDRWTRGAASHALSSALGEAGERAVGRPVADRAHLRNLVRYLLTQPSHHGLDIQAARYDGSCFFDLLGARKLEGFDPQALRRHLPRLRDAELLGIVGLRGLAPAAVQGFALPVLAAASRAVYGAVGTGRTPENRARALAVRAGLEAGFSLGSVAVTVGVTERSVRRYGNAAPDDEGRRALGLQLALAAR
jgi:hypothetical protein